MSLAPPSAAVGTRYWPGQRLWQVGYHGRRRKLAVYTLEITEIIHHYATTRVLTGTDTAGKLLWEPANPFDCRHFSGFFFTEAEARLECSLCTHPLGPLAARLLRGDPADGKARRCTQWGQAINHRSVSPQKYAAALRLLIRHGRAERLPRPKRCPRYRLLPAPVPPLPETLPGIA